MNSFFEMVPLLFIMVLPIVAVVGGITAGIVKSHHRAKMIELAQRERIVAIERGLDISKLPPLMPMPGLLGEDPGLHQERRQARRAARTAVWGVLVASVGLSLTFILLLTVPLDTGAWGSGLFFLMLGAALLISSRIMRPDPDDLRREKELTRQMQAVGYAAGGRSEVPPPPAPAAGGAVPTDPAGGGRDS